MDWEWTFQQHAPVFCLFLAMNTVITSIMLIAVKLAFCSSVSGMWTAYNVHFPWRQNERSFFFEVIEFSLLRCLLNGLHLIFVHHRTEYWHRVFWAKLRIEYSFEIHATSWKRIVFYFTSTNRCTNSIDLFFHERRKLFFYDLRLRLNIWIMSFMSAFKQTSREQSSTTI